MPAKPDPLLGRKPAWLERFERRQQSRLDDAASRRPARLMPTWAIAVGALFAATIFIFLASDIWRTHGWPAERAELIAAPDTPEPDGYNCTSKAVIPSRDLTWRSLDPPSGRPARFTTSNACFPEVEVGDVATVVRVYGDGDEPRLFVNPVLSYTEAVGLTALALGSWFVSVAGVLWFVRRRARDRTTKRSAQQFWATLLLSAGAIAWSVAVAALVPLIVMTIVALLGACLYVAVIAVLVVDQSERLSRLF